MTESQKTYQLTHPLYLDVAMMTNFLAYLEGGVVMQEEATQKEIGSKERAFKGRMGINARFPWALSAEASSEGSGQRRDEVSLESKFERQHTAASLFNSLYEYLTGDGRITTLDNEPQLAELQTSQLVAFSGEYLGNPLEEILGVMGAIYPYISEQYRAQSEAASQAAEKARKAQRSGNPAKRPQAQPAQPDATAVLAEIALQAENLQNNLGAQIMLRMAEDIKQVPVHDLLFRIAPGLQAVLTVSSEYYSQEINEYLRAGEFKVVGKVTRIIKDGGTINLTRRTVLGAASPATAQEIVSSARSSDELKLDVADPIVTAPAVQVLPMAIFI